MNNMSIREIFHTLFPVAGVGDRLNKAIEGAKTTVDALKILTARQELLVQIGQSIKYRPQNWTKIAWNTDLYTDLRADIRDICPNLTDDCDIFLDVSTRIILVRDEGQVLPILFLSRNGGAVVYRMVLGQVTLWLITLGDELMHMEREGKWMGADQELPRPERCDGHGQLSTSALRPDWRVPAMPFAAEPEPDAVAVAESLLPYTDLSILINGLPDGVEIKEFSHAHCDPHLAHRDLSDSNDSRSSSSYD